MARRLLVVLAIVGGLLGGGVSTVAADTGPDPIPCIKPYWC